MHKEKWVYQRRIVEQGEYPWAVLIDIDYQISNRRETIELAFTIFSEKIENATHSKFIEAGHMEHASDYVRLLVSHLAEYSTVCEYDVDQLTNAIFDAILK